MGLMNSIAAQSREMSEAQFQQSYSVSITKKAMDTQEMAARELLTMLPDAPAKGQYIDVYA